MSSPPDTGTTPRPLGDRIGSTVCLVVAVAAMLASISYGLHGRTQVVGPGLFPTVVAACLLVLGAVWAWQAWTGRVAASHEPAEMPDRAGLRRIAVTSLVLLVAAVFFDRVDFRLTMFAIPFVVLRFVFGQPVVRSAAISLVITTVIYLALVEGLGIVLPVFRF